jgi:hypothetical protein
MKYTFTILLSLCLFTALAQSDTLLVNINLPTITQALIATPHEINVGIGQSSKSEQIIYLPYKGGELRPFKLIEYDILPVELRKEIKTYYGQMLDNPSVGCRLTLANGEIRASLLSASGNIIIEKNSQSSSSSAYWVYEAEQNFPECNVEEYHQKNSSSGAGNAVMFTSHGTQLRTYRLALLITNSFYTAGGGTDATVNAYIASIVNNINGLFEKEIAVRFTLVSPNNPVSTNIFYNYGGSTNLAPVITENDTRFGNANFDVGHLLLPTGGGVAYLGVVCNSIYKGGARSGVSPASILVFAHELGHQFAAGHTFNGNGSGNCGPDNRMNNDAYEPGSGNTIMSYANLCNPSSFNITGGKVPYFHTRSQTTMIAHITTRPAGCGVVSNTGNSVPVVTTPSTVTIPLNTPFSLTGSATDADNDPLTYTWEQYNLATVSDRASLGNTANSAGISAVNSTTAPLFRTTQSTNGTRNFPDIAYVIDNANNPPDNVGEDLPNVGRTMNFRLTVRDNKNGGGGVGFSSTDIVVDGSSGPFQISSQNAATLWINNGTNTADITWDVSGTNVAPLNTANVKISFSTDGGATFPVIIAATTPNDGFFNYAIPNVATTQGRIKIEAIGNVYFDINNVDITISSTCSPEVSNITPVTTIYDSPGGANLNLVQTSYGAVITSLSGSVESTDPSGNNVSNDGSGSCFGPFNSMNYDVHPFYIATSGTYTFSRTVGSGSLMLALYDQPYSSGNPCANFLISSGTFNGSGIELSNSLTQTLTPGTYYLVVSSFNSSSPSLPAAYTITPSGGNVYGISPAPDSPYGYTYLIYDTALGNIIAFQADPDLTAFTAGNYRVYGLSYQGGFNLTPYVSTAFTNFQTQLSNGSVCGTLSENFRNVNITSPCPPSLTLVSPANNIASGTVKQEVSGTITATNKVTGGNVKYDAGQNIQLNPGFTVNNGVVFSAYIDGCGGQ